MYPPFAVVMEFVLQIFRRKSTICALAHARERLYIIELNCLRLLTHILRRPNCPKHLVGLDWPFDIQPSSTLNNTPQPLQSPPQPAAVFKPFSKAPPTLATPFVINPTHPVPISVSQNSLHCTANHFSAVHGGPWTPLHP